MAIICRAVANAVDDIDTLLFLHKTFTIIKFRIKLNTSQRSYDAERRYIEIAPTHLLSLRLKDTDKKAHTICSVKYCSVVAFLDKQFANCNKICSNLS
jgi:uncharacterized OsmC-like protein